MVPGVRFVEGDDGDHVSAMPFKLLLLILRCRTPVDRSYPEIPFAICVEWCWRHVRCVRSYASLEFGCYSYLQRLSFRDSDKIALGHEMAGHLYGAAICVPQCIWFRVLLLSAGRQVPAMGPRDLSAWRSLLALPRNQRARLDLLEQGRSVRMSVYVLQRGGLRTHPRESRNRRATLAEDPQQATAGRLRRSRCTRHWLPGVSFATAVLGSPVRGSHFGRTPRPHPQFLSLPG